MMKVVYFIGICACIAQNPIDMMDEISVLTRAQATGDLHFDRGNPPPNIVNIQNVFSEADFEHLFPLRKAEYTYDGFLSGAAYWPDFCADATHCRNELAVMFAHMVQETGEHDSWRQDIPEWRQGLFHVKEMNCPENCVQTYADGNAMYPSQPGQMYYGRGAKQLSWNYNYGPFSFLMTGDKLTFLNNPDLILQPEYVFSAAIWFYMTPRSPKPSMHDVICGYWYPSANDNAQGRRADSWSHIMALTTHIINGAQECQGDTQNARWRFEYFIDIAEFFAVPDRPTSMGDYLSCSSMTQFGEHSTGADLLLFYAPGDWLVPEGGCGCYATWWDSGYFRTLDMLDECEMDSCGYCGGSVNGGPEAGWWTDSNACPATTSSSSTTQNPTTTTTSDAQTTTTTQNPEDFEMEGDQIRVCYFQNWLFWTMPLLIGQNIFEYGFDPSLCTHVNYGFGAFNGAPNYDARMYDVDADPPAYAALNAIKAQHPHLKSMWSTGGWMWNDCDEWQYPTTGGNTCHLFSEMVASEQGSRNHAQSVIAFLRQHNFDGYDIDWEYPVVAGRNGVDGGERPADRANFIRFLRILREAFDAEAAATGNTKLLLTVAVGVGKSNAEVAYDIPQMNEYLDWIGLMTYDLHGEWDGTTGLNAGLYSTPADVETYGYDLSVSWAVDYWLDHGADRNKLLLGLAPYGRGFTLATPGQNQGPLSPILGPSNNGPQTNEPGYLSYFEIADMIDAGATRHFDDVRKSPYIVMGDQWVGYDDPESLKIKVDFLMEKKLRGSMVWAIELDDFRDQKYPCLKAIKSAMAGYREPTPAPTAFGDTLPPTLAPPPTSPPSMRLQPGRCVPCASSDVGCTRPGEASQAWCDERCTGGMNSAHCPVDYCICADTVQTDEPTFAPTAFVLTNEPTFAPTPAVVVSTEEPTFAPTTSSTTNPATTTTKKSEAACIPCTTLDSGCTHPQQASQDWCDARCTEGVNNDLCPVNYCTCSSTNPDDSTTTSQNPNPTTTTSQNPNPTTTTSEISTTTQQEGCVPCTTSDAGCTHPGQADQAWCDGRCTGVNNDLCPVNYCTCSSTNPDDSTNTDNSETTVLDTCVPCTTSDAGCTHPGQADQAWCDGRCDGVNDAVCPVNFCTCPSRRRRRSLSHTSRLLRMMALN